MANNVFANGREVSCKKADGKTICEFPDVCFTPPENPATPPGVPVPYPNTAFAKDTTEGSRSVRISGQEVMLKNISFFKTSTGDEAGSAAKKGIITSTNKGKTYFISWSMDIKYEGKNVVRHMDMTTNNHASPGATGSVPQVEADSQVMPDKECAHENLRRIPRKGEPENREWHKRTGERALARKEKSLDRLLKQADEASKRGDLAKANKLFNSALDLDSKIKGDRFEQKVAKETNAREVSVKVICRDCGKTIQEFDVVTNKGIVKECKASWGQVKEKQFRRQEKLAQRSDIFGPGTVVHLAVPKGERGNLKDKFGSSKEHFVGKIQEH